MEHALTIAFSLTTTEANGDPLTSYIVREVRDLCTNAKALAKLTLAVNFTRRKKLREIVLLSFCIIC